MNNFKVYRADHKSNYTVINNDFLRNNKLSLKAKGLLAVLLSLPDDWAFSIKGLCALTKEGEQAVTSALNELKAAGYVEVKKNNPSKRTNGRLWYQYSVREQSFFTQAQGRNNKAVKTRGWNSRLENPGQLNTKEQSKENKVRRERIDGLSAEVRKAVGCWRRHKRERGETLTDTALCTLAHKILSSLPVYGEKAIVGLVYDCISEGQRNIYFDRLDRSCNQSKRAEGKDAILAQYANLI